MNQEPKTTNVEAFYLGSYILLTDAVGIALFFGGLDDFLILDIMTFPITQMYFRMKKVDRAGWDVVMNIAELVPYIGALPLRSVGFFTVIYIDHNPASFAAKGVGEVSKITSKIPNPKRKGRKIPLKKAA